MHGSISFMVAVISVSNKMQSNLMMKIYMLLKAKSMSDPDISSTVPVNANLE